LRAAMGLVIVVMGAGALLQYFGKSETRKLVGQRASLGDLRPPVFRAVPLASADDFFKRAEATKAKVDEARQKSPGGRGLLADFEPSEQGPAIRRGARPAAPLETARLHPQLS